MASYTENVIVTYSSMEARGKAEELNLRLTSSYRSPARNKQVGGHPNSRHKLGRAYDFAGNWTAMNKFAKWAKKSGLFTSVLWQVAGHYDHVHVQWSSFEEFGESNAVVGAIQERLKELGYYKGALDNIYGPLTDDAVEEFQKDRGLEVDGIAGPITQGELFKETENKGKTLYLPASVEDWRVYSTDVAPVVGNEKAFIKPAKYGGLQYEVLDTPQKDVVTIQTRDFGKVNIYVAPKTGVVIK